MRLPPSQLELQSKHRQVRVAPMNRPSRLHSAQASIHRLPCCLHRCRHQKQPSPLHLAQTSIHRLICPHKLAILPQDIRK